MRQKKGVLLLEFHHVSVLLQECIDGLCIKPDGIYVDGTTGGGGHSLEIAKRLTTGRLICIDQDLNAHAAAKERLKDHLDKITFVHDNFGNIGSILDELGIDRIDGMLMDIGVSSHQLDEAERGFSYQQDAPLDMRMDATKPFSAYDVVNTYSEADLDRIILLMGKNAGQNALRSLLWQSVPTSPSKPPESWWMLSKKLCQREPEKTVPIRQNVLFRQFELKSMENWMCWREPSIRQHIA